MKKKTLTAASIAVAMTMVGFGSYSAAAAETPSDDLSDSEYATLLDQGLVEPTGGSLNLQPKDDGTVGTQATAPLNDGTHRISSQSTGNNVRNTFSSSILIGNAYTFAKVESGSTISTFTGAGTGNVKSDTRLWATGLAISVSAPAGAGFSLGTAEAIFTGNASGVNTTQTSYSGAEFSGPLFTVNQNVTSTWNVGNNTYVHVTN